MSDHLAPPSSIDTLIARQLPAWLRSASADQRAVLKTHLLAQQRAHAQAQRLLGTVTALPVFAEALLAPALERLLGYRLDVRASQLNLVAYLPEASASLGLAQTLKRHVSKQSLLAAALHNFDASETTQGAFSSETRLCDATCQPIALSAERFATLCRTLDIGGQYQRHIQATLAPAGTAGTAAEQILENAVRTALSAAACLARLRGGLDQDNYRRLLALTAPTPVVQPDAHVLKPHGLRVLGKRVNGVLALEVWSSASRAANLESIILWIPGDPIASVSLHGSWRALSIALAGRLAAPGYAAFFVQLLARQDQLAFTQVLARRLHEATPGAPIEIDSRHEAIEGNVFAYLRRRQVEGMLADAKVLAVPTGEEDRRARVARLEGYVNAGLDVLGLASLFVPGLGIALLGITAVQLADEVYEGYQDWQLGDREAALEHVFNVAEGVVGNVLGAVAPVAVVRLAQRSRFVDGLAPILGASGTLRLIDPSLPGYAVPVAEAVAPQPNVRYVETEAGRLKLERSDEHAPWVVVHPTRERAYAPRVEGNAAGGWRHALEAPQQWGDVHELVRRLDGDTATVSDDAVQFALRVTAMSADHIRGLHLENARAPARLRDALARYALHDRWPTLQGEAFEAQVAADQPAVEAAAQVLRRDFPNLTARCANELVEHASQAQVQRLLDEQRVPLALTQQARWALHDARLDRACAGLILPQAVGRDTQRLALGLIEAVAPWADDTRLEIRQDTPQGTLLAQSTAMLGARAQVIVSRQGHYYCVDAAGERLPGSRLDGTLNEALLLRLDPLQKLLLGKADLSASELGACLLERANQSRERAAKAMGLVTSDQGVRPPLRLGDGRVGYPLSGRGESSRQAFVRGLRQLYPTFSDADIDAYLHQLQQRGLDPWNHLHDLHEQLGTLRSVLDAWQAEPDTVWQRLRRRETATRIRQCWRRKRGGVDGSWLVIEGVRVGQLPALPERVDFGHVQALVLRDMALTDLPESFLPRFGNLRVLDVSHNRLTRLPAGLESLVHIRELRLGGNRIVWAAEDDQRIAALTHLHTLGLSGNPLRVMPDFAALRTLRHVSMRNTSIEQVPAWVQHRPFIEMIDLRENVIQRLRRSWSDVLLRRLFMHDNPLERASMVEINQAMQVGQAASSAQDIAHLHAPVDAGARDHWLRHVEEGERSAHQAIWNSLNDEPGSGDLLRFFADLADSNEFLRQPRQLTRRVWRILRACERDARVREALFQQAAGPRTCADRTLIVLSQLEIGTLVAEQTQGYTGALATRALLRLGRSLHRLDEVDRIATAHIERLRNLQPVRPVDDIEVIMAYRVYLAGPLGLPEQPDHMYFGSHSRVSALDINVARTTILARENNPVLAESLVQRDFWVNHLRERFGHLLEEMNAPFHVRLEALEGWNTLFGEQAYLDKVEQLAAERQQAEHALWLRLTLEELEMGPH
ncbi:hypothetical protein G7Z99_01075 [Pseudomonas entomophila]|uniref:NEL-type E3 ubiquitin ligase domain-containing protein n=1 Tax=Pseudomonas entomophila TaxID=312306 RepID=UPI0015E3004F|nr:NEL-type E3 ubiquitin ligase domain-containing protein [Pseudomonas entomophila]MBA1187638.1 hypothetical protein [Pseudomonas entomophila]